MTDRLFDDDDDPGELPVAETDMVLDKEAQELARTPQQLGIDEITADFPWAKGLTYMQTLFVLAYTGDTAAAARSISC